MAKRLYRFWFNVTGNLRMGWPALYWLTGCFFLQSTFLSAQDTLIKGWDKSLGGNQEEWLQATLVTADGGYLLYGNTNSDLGPASRGGDDWWLVKLDAKGTKTWDKLFDSGGYDYVGGMIPTPDGGYLLGGTSDWGEEGELPAGAQGQSDWWLVKINAEGKEIWQRQFGGKGKDYLTSLTPSPDGGYLLGGLSDSAPGGDKTQPTFGNADFWVMKVNVEGHKVWDRTYGGAGNEFLMKVVTTPDGGYLLGGVLLPPREAMSVNQTGVMAIIGSSSLMAKESRCGTNDWAGRALTSLLL